MPAVRCRSTVVDRVEQRRRSRRPCGVLLWSLVLVASFAVERAVATPPMEEAVHAWTTARGWLDSLQLPRMEEPAAAVSLPRTHGISVILRVGGRVVGRGEHIGVDGLALRIAMGRAMTDLFADATLTRFAEVEPQTLGRRITLEIELAGEPIPLLGATFAEVSTRIEPGIDGIALRRGERIAMAFPGRLLASNTAGNPVSVFGALCTELGLGSGAGLGLRDLPDLRRDAAMEVYRVPVTRLVQPTEEAMPLAPMRGGQLVADRDVAWEALSLTLAGMTDRMLQQRYRGPLAGLDEVVVFRGDYRPVADQSRQPVASPFEQALIAYALCRIDVEGIEHGLITAARQAAESTLLALQRIALAQTQAAGVEDDAKNDHDWSASLDPRALAMVAMAAAELLSETRPMPLSQASRIVQILDAAGARLRSSIGADGDYELTDEAGLVRAATGHDQALAAAALAMLAVHRPSETASATAAAALDVAWRSVPETLQPGLLPWVAIAERLLVELKVVRDPMPLIRLRESILSAQVGFNDLTMPADLHGGFALVAAHNAPTSQSLRPMVALALLFGDARVTPEPVRETIWHRQRATARFMLQLTVLPPMDGQYRNGVRARFGVRAALWDSDQPVAAQAMGLLAAAETLRVWPSFDRDGSP